MFKVIGPVAREGRAGWPRRWKPRALDLVRAALLVAAGATVGLEAQSDPAPTPLNGEVKPKHAYRITLSGEMKLSLVARNNDIFRAALGDAVTGAAGSALVSTPAGSGTHGDTFIDPVVTLNMNFELADKVSAVLELETPFDELGTRAGGVTPKNRDLEAELAFIRMERAFDQELTLQVGIQEFRKDFTDSGNPFFVDVRRSESPFGNPSSTNDRGAPQASSSGSPGIQEAAGVDARYMLGDNELDLFYFILSESFRSQADDVLWGATLERSFDLGGNRANLGALVAVLQSDSDSFLWTFGLGGYTHVMDNSLKLYGEVYTQAGRYGTLTDGRKIKQRDTFAVYGGFRYALPGPESLNAYVDASYWELSGDHDGDDHVNENFVSLENNNDTIVFEDGYYGLDIDTNYRAVKLKAGFDPFESVSFKVLGAWFGLQDNNGLVDNAQTKHSRMGNELDLILNYRPSENLLLQVRSGWLFDPKALGLREDLNVTVVEAALHF